MKPRSPLGGRGFTPRQFAPATECRRVNSLQPLCLLAVVSVLAASRLIAHGDSTLEIEALTAAIAEAPNRPELYLRRAEHHAEHANWKAAEADIERAAEYSAGLTEVAAAMAKVYFESGRLAAAADVLNIGLARFPDDAELLILRARVWRKLEAAEAAYSDYAAAIRQLATPRPEVFLECAALAISAEKRLALLEDGLNRVGTVVTLVERAVELELMLGRVDRAVERLDRLIGEVERKEIWLKRRGDVLAQAGRTTEARQSYAAAGDAIKALPGWLRDSPGTAQLAREIETLVFE